MISGVSRRLLLLAGGLWLAGGAVRAQPAEWDIARLMGLMRGVRVADARFAETRRVGLLNQDVVSAGELHYRAPDRLEKLTSSPVASRLVLAGEVLTLEQAGAPTRSLSLAQVPQIAALVGAIRWTLSGDLVALSGAFVVQLGGDSAGWRLELVPRAAEVQALVRRVVISGVGVALTAVRTEEADGDSDEMVITPEAP